jgi:hypothetical protein
MSLEVREFSPDLIKLLVACAFALDRDPTNPCAGSAQFYFFKKKEFANSSVPGLLRIFQLVS